MSEKALLPANKPMTFSARNHRPVYKRLRAGDWYGSNFEHDETTFDALKTVPDEAVWEIVAWWHYPDDDTSVPAQEKPKKEPKPKGAFGSYWRELCKSGLFNHPDLQSAIEDELPGTTDYEQGLRDIFEVTSRTFISPEDFEDWLAQRRLDGVISLSRQASVKAGE